MVIAINTIFFTKKNEADFLKKVFDRIMAAHPEHTFLLITTDESVRDTLPNVIVISPGPPPTKINHWFFWIYFKLKGVVKKYQPDFLINSSDALFHFKKIPQIVFDPDLRFVQDPKEIVTGLRRVYDLFAPRYYRKAQGLIVFSEFEKNFLQTKFQVNEHKIKIVNYGALAESRPVDEEERESIKDKYAKGFEYFLSTGFISQSDHLVKLLKSFSAFKKRQRSSMQLLIMGTQGIHFDEFKKSLHLYRYKEDVHLITEVGEFDSQRIVASAYALIFSYKFDKRSDLLLTALQFEVPSIVSDSGSLSKVGDDAVLHFEAGNIPDLAEKMMHLFKDENSRKKLIENSKGWIDETCFERCIRDTWKIIDEMVV